MASEIANMILSPRDRGDEKPVWRAAYWEYRDDAEEDVRRLRKQFARAEYDLVDTKKKLAEANARIVELEAQSEKFLGVGESESPRVPSSGAVKREVDFSD